MSDIQPETWEQTIERVKVAFASAPGHTLNSGVHYNFGACRFHDCVETHNLGQGLFPEMDEHPYTIEALWNIHSQAYEDVSIMVPVNDRESTGRDLTEEVLGESGREIRRRTRFQLDSEGCGEVHGITPPLNLPRRYHKKAPA